MLKNDLLSTVPIECSALLLSRAKQCTPMRVAVVNATTPVVLESVRMAYDAGLIDPVLVGSPLAIGKAADSIGWDTTEIAIEFAGNEQMAAGIAVALAANDEVSGLMKGDVHTDVLMRAVLNRHGGLRTERLMSHVFHMSVPGCERALCITDAVLNVLPTLEQKRHIVSNAVSLMSALGNSTPRIALLSAAETVSVSMPSTVDAQALAAESRNGSFAAATVDGPLAFDLAVSAKAAAAKGADSPVAGNADVLVVPNIEAGNALFKMMVYFMSAAAAGIVLGAKVPIMLTSRADPAAARLASVALAAVYAEYNEASR